MKKIIAMLLALTCVFAMFACNDEEVPCTVHIDEDKNNACDVCGADVTPEEEPEVNAYPTDAAAFISALDTTVVNNLRAEVTVTIEGEPITSTYTTVYYDDYSEMTYKIASIPGVDTADDVVYEEGTVRCDENGNYVGINGTNVSGMLGATGVKLNLKSDKITNYTVNGNVLTIKLDATSASAVVGYAIGIDATLVVTRAADQIVSITLSYGNIEIVCSYNVA